MYNVMSAHLDVFAYLNVIPEFNLVSNKLILCLRLQEKTNKASHSCYI